MDDSEKAETHFRTSGGYELTAKAEKFDWARIQRRAACKRPPDHVGRLAHAR